MESGYLLEYVVLTKLDKQTSRVLFIVFIVFIVFIIIAYSVWLVVSVPFALHIKRFHWCDI
jgi:heme/copper-type cytochrome/quinol oxidase subunit 4